MILTVSGGIASRSQIRSTAGYSATIGRNTSAPMTPASVRADREREDHRQIRQPQLAAVDLRRDVVVLDDVVGGVEDARRRHPTQVDTVSPSRTAGIADMKMPITGSRSKIAVMSASSRAAGTSSSRIAT